MDTFYEVEKVVEVIKEGGIVLYPTDTIWGIGCDATNPTAVEQIYNLKKRPKEKSFILLVDSVDMLKNYVEQIHPRIETLLDYHQRPLTIIYDQPKNLPQEVIHNSGTIGIRLTHDPFCKQIIQQLGRPIVSTSANLSGQTFSGHFGGVSSEIIIGVDYVVRHRQKEKQVAPPSVIMRMSDEEELILIRG